MVEQQVGPARVRADKSDTRNHTHEMRGGGPGRDPAPEGREAVEVRPQAGIRTVGPDAVTRVVTGGSERGIMRIYNP